jgi:hypothetical protein
MCRLRIATSALLAVVLCCGSAGYLQAQQQQAYIQRVDSLARVYQRAQSALAAHRDSLNRSGRSWDTLIVGPLRVLTDDSTADIARQGAERVVATLTQAYGFALSGISHYPLIVHRVGGPKRELWRPRPDMIRVAVVGKPGHANDIADVEPLPDVVYQTMLSGALMALGNITDSALVRWLGEQPPIEGTTPEMWTRARLAMLSSHSIVARRCYARDVGACKIALDLTPATDTVLQWFDSTDRRRLVVRNETQRWDRIDESQNSACLAGSDSACVTILRQHPNLRIGPPLQPRHRVTLVRMASELGGAGAVERLLTTRGSQMDRVAAAAKLPPDSLLKLWVGKARGTEVASDDMSPTIAASSLVWILACAGLALRSSRWR